MPGQTSDVPKAQHPKDAGTPEAEPRTAGAAAGDELADLHRTHGVAADQGQRGAGEAEDRGGAAEEVHALHGVDHVQERHVAPQDVQAGQTIPGSR